MCRGDRGETGEARGKRQEARGKRQEARGKTGEGRPVIPPKLRHEPRRGDAPVLAQRDYERHGSAIQRVAVQQFMARRGNDRGGMIGRQYGEAPVANA